MKKYKCNALEILIGRPNTLGEHIKNTYTNAKYSFPETTIIIFADGVSIVIFEQGKLKEYDSKFNSYLLISLKCTWAENGTETITLTLEERKRCK